MMRKKITKTHLTAKDLRRIFFLALLNLDKNKKHINDLNVFPVADGDTGTNMWLTVKSAVGTLKGQNNPALSDLIKTIIEKSLLGARGNSGVILAQFIDGWLGSFSDREEISILDFCHGLQIGSNDAYQAMIDPVEGTILTVMKDVATEAVRLKNQEMDFLSLFRKLNKCANLSLKQTTELLPVLKEAGVVDAGAQGFVYFLEAFQLYLERRKPKTGFYPKKILINLAKGTFWGIRLPFWLIYIIIKSIFRLPGLVKVRQELKVWYEKPKYRFCVELMAEGTNIKKTEVKKILEKYGDSIILGGSVNLLKVHIHTDQPGAIEKIAQELGQVIHITKDDMYKRQEEFLAAEKGYKHGLKVVAVVWGDGLAKIFESLGADPVIIKGNRHPSIKELMEGIKNTAVNQVIVLPNDGNVINTAKQAVSLINQRVEIIPTKTVPEGITAMLAFNQEQDLDANVQAMSQSYRQTRTGRIARAVKNATLDQKNIKKGEYIGISSGEVLAKNKDYQIAALDLIKKMISHSDQLISIYYGKKIARAEAQSLADDIKKNFTIIEVQFHYGGQKNSEYLISIE